ncbi:MAG: YfhO family protein, partial [Candidatus Aminicenantes bacterium]|nr:YfhO family protein [Candidatus Aminicenantes bacterium]
RPAGRVPDTEAISDDGKGPLPRSEGCGQEAVVTFEELTLHGVRARARMPCAAYLVFGDAHFPGWKATIDGKPATLYRAYGALRAVFVPAGEHEVEFVYRPRSVILGASLSGLCLLGCLVLVFVNRRRGGARSTQAVSRTNVGMLMP